MAFGVAPIVLMVGGQPAKLLVTDVSGNELPVFLDQDSRTRVTQPFDVEGRPSLTVFRPLSAAAESVVVTLLVEGEPTKNSYLLDSGGVTVTLPGAPGSALGNAAYVPQALNQRGIWAALTVYAIGDAVIAPTGDIVIPRVAFTSGVSYSAANWYILVPAAGFPGRKLGSAVLATGTGFTLSAIGPISGLTDTTKDVNTALLDVSVVIGSRPVMVEARVAAWFGTTGTYGIRLYDKTAGTIQDQDQRTGITAFQIVAPSTLKALLTPAAGIRNYGVKYNGTVGTNNMQISGASDNCQSWIQVTEL